MWWDWDLSQATNVLITRSQNFALVEPGGTGFHRAFTPPTDLPRIPRSARSPELSFEQVQQIIDPGVLLENTRQIFSPSTVSHLTFR